MVMYSDGQAVLTLDLGTTTGWALRHGDGRIESGSRSQKADRFSGGGMRYLKFRRWLTEMKNRVGGIREIYFEAVRAHKGTGAAHIYGGFLATLTTWAEHHNIPYEGVGVTVIKKHATGKGNAGKAVMIKAMEQKGHTPIDDNEADALAIMYWALEQIGDDE